jgi:23S rRNA (cytosine1962-C5)-methyltransferase
MRAHINPGMKVLNLFGYTGVASLVAARAGAEVVHVDASKKAIGFAKENAELAGLSGKPIRWLTDDALAFVKREVRRGNRYHVLLLDPPKFGRGPDGEKWEFFDNVPELLEAAAQITEPGDSLTILTAYALRASAVAMESALRDAYNGTGAFTHGDLTVTDQHGRSFATAMWARRQS